jgi:uncharacterized protein
MSLEAKVTEAMKDAMKSKNTIKLESVRAIKSAILLMKTSGEEFNEAAEMKMLQKLVKQRKESAELYLAQNREDLANPELEQIKYIEEFLPAALSPEEIEAAIKNIIAELGATTIKDMGKVVAKANADMAGRADGKFIAETVKKLLA